MTDLDGTLWRSGAVHPVTREALTRLGELGIRVVGATARRPPSAHQALAAQELELDAVLINDGALGYHRLEEDAWRRCAFSEAATRRLVEVLAQFGHEPMFETEHLGEGVDVIVGERPSIPREYLATTPPLRADLAEPLPHPVYAAVAIVEPGWYARNLQDLMGFAILLRPNGCTPIPAPGRGQSRAVFGRRRTWHRRPRDSGA